MPKLITSNEVSATIEDLRIKGSFDLFICNSNEPSKTMRINPVVPKIGKIRFNFGTGIFRLSVTSFVPNPKTKSNITAGIFVLEDVISKTYANNSKIEIVIINCIAILSVCYCCKVCLFRLLVTYLYTNKMYPIYSNMAV